MSVYFLWPSGANRVFLGEFWKDCSFWPNYFKRDRFETTKFLGFWSTFSSEYLFFSFTKTIIRWQDKITVINAIIKIINGRRGAIILIKNIRNVLKWFKFLTHHWIIIIEQWIYIKYGYAYFILINFKLYIDK